ncbi:SoxR reducing system RseC family protein [Halomonas sp. V046]|uniref:SoxR reducing system RseC family protein n=1 Tax=Halomonas sp. V046 TaxID=3459611 RepID=UPI0040448AE8
MTSESFTSRPGATCGVTAEGVVVGWVTGGVRVALSSPRGCSGCSRRGGCGAGVLERAGARDWQLEVAADPPPAIGSRVEVGVSAATLTRASVLVYGIPLWLALGVAWGVDRMYPDHLGVPVAFGFGLAVGGLALRRYLRRRDSRFRPILVDPGRSAAPP